MFFLGLALEIDSSTLRAPADPFCPVSGAAALRLHGSVLQKVATVRPILDHDWFLEQIGRCEQRYEALRDGAANAEGGLAKLLEL